MKFKAMAVLATCFSGVVHAHSLMPANMNNTDKQNMMAAIQQLQDCFSKIDQNSISSLQQRSNRFASELRLLCINNKRHEAEKNAVAFYGEMMKIDTVKESKACGDEIPEAFKGYLSTPLDLSQFVIREEGHICDHEILPVDQFSGHYH